MTYLLFAAVILLVVVLAVAVIALRLPARPKTPAPRPPSGDDRAARLERRRALEGQEDELLRRRVQLDARRGPLGGDAQLFEALDRLEQRFRAGEIGEAEFEAEKIRLLSG